MNSSATEAPAACPKPHLMLFINGFLHGGTERQFVRTVQLLDLEKYKLFVGCLHRSGPFLSEIENRGVEILEFPIRSLYGFDTVRWFCRLVRFLRHNHIAVLHAFDFYTDMFAVPAARLAGVPVVLASRRELLDMRTPWQRCAVRAACWLATGVVANSHAVEADLCRRGYLKPRQLTVIHNSIDCVMVRRAASPQRIRTRLGIPPGSPLIGLLADLRPEKDVETFLRAAAHIAAEMEKARFLVIGDGDDRQRLEQIALQLGLGSRVLFLGDQAKVEDLLAELDVCVLSSRTESLPNAALEAMAMARPVVATNAGGTKELVVEGETGFLVPIRDPKTMAVRIMELVQNTGRARDMGNAGRKRIEQEFSCSRMKQQLEALYDASLRKRHPTARILQIGNYPPPLCGWSMHTQSIHRALEACGAVARVMDIGPGRRLHKPGSIPVRNAFDFLNKLVTYRLRGFRFQPHVNGDSWKGYGLATVAVLLGRLTGKPACLMFHAGPRQRFFPRYRGFWFYAFRLLFTASGEIICNSEPVRQAIHGYGIAAHKIHPIFSVDYTPEEIPVPLPARVETFLQQHEPRLFSYTMFRPEFTMEALFGALVTLRQNYPQVGLVICGPTQVPKDADEQMRRLGIESNILIAGNLPHTEFLSAIRRSDVFIRTHLRDGQCASVIEALNLGVPVVAADDGMRPPSVVTYKPGDAADLSLKTSRVLSDIERFRRQVQSLPLSQGLESEVSLLISD